MAKMVSVQIRLPQEELKRIDNYVTKGEYPSRSEYIRDAVRKAEMFDAFKRLGRIMNEEGISEKDLLEGGKEIREKLFQEMFGDNE
ncbi:MAG: ribbon-helix-helix protein, CopG family [Candidatus Thermoplasmatota archaeon]|nr:ribbon-helix-helix protein, CopG family [Candidatus Thermoplasmatota archaeon]